MAAALDPVAGLPERGFRARLQQRLALLVYRGVCFGLNHMAPFRLFFAALRRLRPVARIGSTLWVTKAEDVREVLSRFEDFELGQVIEPGMPWGTFMMTIDWRVQHALERAQMQAVVRRDDAALIRRLCVETCAGLRPTGGRLDVVADIAEPVGARLCRDYFGAALPDRVAMAEMMADLAGIIMVNPPVGSAPWARSRRSIDALTAAVMARVAAVRGPGGAGEPDTLLTRLVRLQAQGGQPDWFDDDWIRRYITGLVGTGGATIIRASTHAIDQLLDHPQGLREAQAAVAQLDRDPDNAAALLQLRKVVYEALRFKPMLSLLVRDCPRDTVIAAGTPRARIVPAGTKVFAPPLAAMWDPQAVPEPSRFDSSRPDDAYLLFGHGVRECFGRYVADIAILEIVRAAVRLPGLARAPGADGRIGYDGGAARHLAVTCSAEARP
jgi:cytochrome P450